MSTLTRRSLREHLLKLLYLRDFHTADELDEQFDLYISCYTDLSGESDEAGSIRERYDSIVSKLSEIDSLIERSARGWKFNRIGKTELNILRIAIYEMKYDESVPESVAINEAVEITKQYGSDDSSYGFVNGILGTLSEKNK
ncbi:MAG: transcription antitermination factor NusB [Lachnospiraceae bacterium]|nr:transcription antitermination factor NusB [Lachnospiraceae bacterium]